MGYTAEPRDSDFLSNLLMPLNPFKNCYHGNFSLASILRETLQVLMNSTPLVSVRFSWVLERVALTERTFKPTMQKSEMQMSSRVRQLGVSQMGQEGCEDLRVYRGPT